MDEHQEKLEMYKELFTNLGISENLSIIFAEAYETGEILLAIRDNLMSDNGRVHVDVLNSLIKIERAYILKIRTHSEGSNIFNVYDRKSNQIATFNYYDAETSTYAFNFRNFKTE